MTHSSPANPLSRSLPMLGRATFTTVASSDAMPDPRTVAARTHRPRAVPNRRGSVAGEVTPGDATDAAHGTHRAASPFDAGPAPPSSQTAWAEYTGRSSIVATPGSASH